MTRRERLMATLRGNPVDRPAVNFYELGGFRIDPSDPDPFNIYSSPSWQPLLRLAEEHTDLSRMRSAANKPAPDNCAADFISSESYTRDGSRFWRTRIEVAGRTLTSLSRRDPDVDTTWVIEHLLKDVEDAEAYLQLPDAVFAYEPDVSDLVKEDEELGHRGIIMVDVADPICCVAGLFSMEDYTVVALTEQELFHSLLEKFARWLDPWVEEVARQFPGHLWRICGPEYATEPYLPPYLFDEYVVRYTGPMVRIIQRYGGFGRIHCHGRLKSVLPYIAGMGADGLDPIEPPPQGDVDLSYVRREYGRDMVLFGNIEVANIENAEPAEFEKIAARALSDGTGGEGRGFVLMPTACPCGRDVSARTMANYEAMVRLAESFAG